MRGHPEINSNDSQSLSNEGMLCFTILQLGQIQYCLLVQHVTDASSLMAAHMVADSEVLTKLVVMYRKMCLVKNKEWYGYNLLLGFFIWTLEEQRLKFD